MNDIVTILIVGYLIIALLHKINEWLFLKKYEVSIDISVLSTPLVLYVLNGRPTMFFEEKVT